MWSSNIFGGGGGGCFMVNIGGEMGRFVPMIMLIETGAFGIFQILVNVMLYCV
jgi:hypothetical protein